MIKNWIKKIPFFSYWLANQRIRSQYEISQYQLELSLNALTNLKLDQLIFFNRRAIQQKPSAHRLIVSLTSYGPRINSVHHVMTSLLYQTHRANRVILWLSENEFKIESLPKPLLKLQQYGLEIKFCPDIGAYKKLIPCLVQYPNDTILTFDDDVIYPHNQIERLYYTHLSHPKTVICHRAHQLTFTTHRQIRPYAKWIFDADVKEPRRELFPIGIGGVLYPPNCFDKEVFNQKAFMKLAPDADDLWFKIMALKKGTLAKIVDDPIPYRDYLQIPTTQQYTLWQRNKTRNDKQLNAILLAYPEIEFTL